MDRAPSVSRDEMIAMLRNFGIHDADDGLIARAMELSTATREHLARLPRGLSKDLEPAHVFSLPLR